MGYKILPYFSTYYTQQFFLYRNSTPFTVCSQVLKQEYT